MRFLEDSTIQRQIPLPPTPIPHTPYTLSGILSTTRDGTCEHFLVSQPIPPAAARSGPDRSSSAGRCKLSIAPIRSSFRINASATISPINGCSRHISAPTLVMRLIAIDRNERLLVFLNSHEHRFNLVPRIAPRLVRPRECVYRRTFDAVHCHGNGEHYPPVRPV